MDNTEKKIKLNQIIKRTQVYSDLVLYPSFQVWKKNVIDNRLKGFQETAMNTLPDTPEHNQAVIRYQELKYVTNDIFKTFQSTEERARKELKKI
jgi:hypothetical protein